MRCSRGHTCAEELIESSFGVKKLTLPIAVALTLSIASCARADQNQAWTIDYKKAQQEAKASHKLLLIDFTGSDWCGFCLQLDKAILSQPQFKDYASKNLVLMEVDFPRRKAQNSETRKQNQELAQRYQIEGFPTLVVLNGEGKTLWRYDGLYMGGVAAFLAELDKVRKG